MSWQRFGVLFFFILWSATLSGCATLSFKRGASPESMAADERACRSTTSDETAFQACMRDRGWFVGKIGSSPSGEPAAVPVIEPTPAAPAEDPLTRVSVASWWKLGGTAAGLDQAIAKCVTELGDAHKPEAGATVVTIGLRECLRTAGWYGIEPPGK